jgi:hypothetical protein
MKSTPAHVRLERKLARDRTAILSASDVQLLNRELRRAVAEAFPGLPADALDRSEDVIRWSALGRRCKAGRDGRGIRVMSVITGIPQYRLRAIESGRLSEIEPGLARRYSRCLGIEEWVAQWCRANRELAQRAGLLDRAERSTRTRSAGKRPTRERTR